MIRFDPKEYPNPNTMTFEELIAYRDELQGQIEDLDSREPANMESEAYEVWADAHEELEDLLDDIQDRLDELEG